MPVPRIVVEGLPAGRGLASRLGELAAAGARPDARLVRGDGRPPEIAVAAGDGRLVVRFPARLGGRLTLVPADDGEHVRARLEFSVLVEARVRAPARRRAGEVPAGEIEADSRGTLAVEADLPAEITLRDGLRRLARLARPGRWLARPAPPAGARWSLVHQGVLGLEASALLRETLVRRLGADASLARLAARVELSARLETTLRTRVTLAATSRGTIRGSLAVLGRHSERIAARSTLRLRIAEPERLAHLVLDGLLGGTGELYERLAELELGLEKVRRGLVRLERRLESASLRLAGPGSTLARIERALARALDALEIADAEGELADELQRLLDRVREVRREIAELAGTGGRLLRRLLRETGLERLLRRVGRFLTNLEELAEDLPRAAGTVLAEGLAAELSASLSRAREGSELARVELVPGRAGTREAVAALLAGRIDDLARMEPGSRGILSVTGRAVRATRKRRTLGLRVRVGGRVFAARRALEERLRVTASWDGALVVEAGARLTRRREGIEGLAGLTLDFAEAGGPGRVDPVFVLSWREHWPPGGGARKRALARSPGLAAVAAVTGEPRLVPPPRCWGLTLRARLLPADVRAMFRPGWPARRFVEEAFWPAWLAALESAAARSSRNVLDADGRHPLRDPALRRLLASDPSGASLRDLVPGKVARETVAADFRVARAVLGALGEVRRALRRPSRNLAALRRATEELASALGHYRTIDPAPLLALVFLVPPNRRRVQLEWDEPTPRVQRPSTRPSPPTGLDDIPFPW